MSVKILVSACLLGRPVRYDGQASAFQERLADLQRRGCVVVFCPEVAGGLPVPRPPAEIVSGDGQGVLSGRAWVRTAAGDDVSEAFLRGARLTLALAQEHKVVAAVLKARSPSCGNAMIYDGSHTRTLVDGMGVTAALLVEHGIPVFNENEIDALDAFDFGD